MKINPAAWLPIPGFPGYEIRADGAVRKRKPWGFRPVYTRVYRGIRIASLSVDGRQKTCRVAHLLGRAFLRKLRKGECYSHRNWDVLDDVASNICIRTHSEIGKRSGQSGTRRRAVEQVDAEGNVIGAYRSVKQAAKATYLSPKCVADRCNGALRTNPPPFFRWAE